MSTYTFRNTETNEIVEHSMSYKDLDQFQIDNPTLERYHSVATLPSLGDPMRMNVGGVGKPDKAFEQGVIQRIKDNVPGNRLNETHKTKLPREW
jgi:hypothetical protein